MDLSILAIWSEAKVSEDHVAGTKVKRVSSAQPVGSVLTAWISYQTSIDWGCPVGVWEIEYHRDTTYLC